MNNGRYGEYGGQYISETLMNELLYLEEFDSMEHFIMALEDYLDYYNNRRIKVKLKGLPPAVHRKQALLIA